MQQAADVSELCPEQGFGLPPAHLQNPLSELYLSSFPENLHLLGTWDFSRCLQARETQLCRPGVTGGGLTTSHSSPARCRGAWPDTGDCGPRMESVATADAKPPSSLRAGAAGGSLPLGREPAWGDLWLGASVLPGFGLQQGSQHR